MTIHEKLPTIQLTSKWLQRRRNRVIIRIIKKYLRQISIVEAYLEPAVSLLTFHVFRLFRLFRHL